MPRILIEIDDHDLFEKHKDKINSILAQPICMQKGDILRIDYKINTEFEEQLNRLFHKLDIVEDLFANGAKLLDFQQTNLDRIVEMIIKLDQFHERIQEIIREL